MLRAFLILLPCWWCTLAAHAASPGEEQRQSVGPLTLELPAHWIKEVRPDGTIAFLTAPEGRGRSEVQLSSTEIPNMEADAAHSALWSAIVRQVSAPAEQASGEVRGFKWSETAAIDSTAQRRFYYRLYTTKLGATCVVVLIGIDSSAGFRQAVSVVDAALSKAQLPGARASISAAAGPQLNDVLIAEAYIHTEVRAISMTSNVLTDHILLFKNGLAVRLGFINGPRECYATLPVVNLTSPPSNYGRWREANGRAIEITWQEGPAWRLERSGDRVSLAGKVLSKFRPIDGTKLDGRYHYSPAGGPPTTLRFTREGKFEARNLTDNMLCTGSARIENGSGRYEVRQWTLILRFNGGGTVLLPLKIADQDAQRPASLTVRSYEFVPLETPQAPAAR